MAIISSLDIGEERRIVMVDEDPTVVLPDVPSGSWILYGEIMYRRTATGLTRDLSLHSGSHDLSEEDAIPSLPTSDQKAALDNASPAPSAGNPFITGADPLLTDFGRYFTYASSEGQSSTTSASWQQKLRLTTPDVPAGTYIVKWSFEWRQSSTSRDFQARVQYDDTDDLMNMNEEPKDGSNYNPRSGFIVADLSAGVHTIDLDYSAESGSGTSYIRRARLLFFKAP